MGFLKLFTIVLATYGSAQAAGISCSSNAYNRGNGGVESPQISYEVFIHPNREDAEIFIRGRGINDRRELNCSALPMPERTYPDAIYSTLACKERGFTEIRGMLITLGEGGFYFHREIKIEDVITIENKVERRVIPNGRLMCKDSI